MRKSCFGLLAAFSFAAIANPDSSFNKKKAKLGANGIRIVLEQTGKMRHPNFSKMMLISKKFNGAAESLTGKKAPFSFLELSSSLNFDFDKGEPRQTIKKFVQLKKLILSSSKGKKHLAFQNIRDWIINDIAEILNHKPIQNTLESLTLIHFQSNNALQNALQNLKKLKSLSLTRPELSDVNILEILNHKSIQDTLESLCLQELSLDPYLTSALKNLKQLRSLSFRDVDFQNQHIQLPLSLENLSIKNGFDNPNIPNTFWDSLSSSHIKNFIFEDEPQYYTDKSEDFFLDAFAKWDHLESLTIRVSTLGSVMPILPKNLKTLRLMIHDIYAGSSLENLSKLQDLCLETNFCNEEFLRSLSPGLHPDLKNLNIQINYNHFFVWEYLKNFNQLETLFLFLEEPLFLHLETEVRFPESLKSLTFGGDAIWKEIFFPESLTFLDLSNMRFINTKLKFPKRFKYLNSLNILNAEFENAEIEFPESINFLNIARNCRFKNTKIEWPNPLKSLYNSCYDFENTDTNFFKSVQCLNLYGCEFHNQALSFSLALTELKIKDCKFFNTLIRFPESLKYLSFDDCPEQESDCQKLETLQYCNQLETLVLSLGHPYKKEISLPNNIKFLTLPCISAVAFLPDHLEELVIHRLHEAFCPLSASLKSLKSLKIHHVSDRIKNLNLEKLFQLENLEMNFIGMRSLIRSLILPPSLKSLKISEIELECLNLEELSKLERLEIRCEIETLTLPPSLKCLKITAKKKRTYFLENLSQLENLEIGSDFRSLIAPSSLRCLKIESISGDIGDSNLDKLSQLESLEIKEMYCCTTSRITPILPSSLTFLKIDIIHASKVNLNLENLVRIEKLHLALALRKPERFITIENVFFPASLKALRLSFLDSKDFQFSEAFLSKMSTLPNLKTLELEIPAAITKFSLPVALTFLKIEKSGQDNHNVFWKNLILPSSLEHLTIISEDKNFLQLLKLPENLKELIIDVFNSENPGHFLSLPASLKYLEAPQKSIDDLILPESLNFFNADNFFNTKIFNKNDFFINNNNWSNEDENSLEEDFFDE